MNIWLCDNPECDYTRRTSHGPKTCPECGFPVVGYEKDPREIVRQTVIADTARPARRW